MDKIKNVAQRLGIITVEDMERYTALELIMMIANKLKECQEIVNDHSDKIQHLLDDELLSAVEQIFNEWTQDGTFDTLINQSALKTVNDRIDNTNTQLSVAKSKQKIYISEYARLGGETNDYERLMRAYNDTKQTLVINQPIDLGGNDFIIEKKIEVDGVGTTISNTEIRVKASHCWLHDFILKCNGKENGISAHETTVDGTTIERVKVKEARAHSFLFESYNGTVSDTIVKDCESYGSIHGFISKANSTSFIRCSHYQGNGGYSFGFISDDMGGNMASCVYNKMIDCRAEDSGDGLYIYARRYKDGSAQAQCRDIYVNGFECFNVRTPLSIGEPSPKDDMKEVYQIKRANISNVFIKSAGKFDIQVTNATMCDFANIMGCRQPYVEASEKLVDIYTRSSFSSAIEETVYEDIVKINETGNCNVTNYKIFNVQANGTTTNKVSITGYAEYGKEITILVHSLGGDLTYGGFDTSKFITRNLELPTTLTYNQVLVTKWVYSRTTNKWLNTHHEVVAYVN